MKRYALVALVSGLSAVSIAQNPKLDMKVGKPLPAFKMTTTKGEKLTNASLRGKVVLLDFWATWCGPCKAATPTIQKLHAAYGGKGLKVIGADTYENGSKNTAAPYAKAHGYTYSFTENNDKLAQSLGIDGIPAFVLVDKKGIIRKVFTGFPGADALYSQIEAAAKPLLKG